MHKFKNILGNIGITLLIWTVARFVPAIIGGIFPDAVVFKLISFILFLPLGWLAAKKLSKEQHPRCIRTNLYIFAVLEISGLFTAINYLIQSLTLSTGRYSTDAYGVPYSDYAMLYGMMLIFGIVYIVMCFKLASKTLTVKQEVTPQEAILAETKDQVMQAPRETKKNVNIKTILNGCLVTLCYWLILFVGPAIVLLWNNFSYYVAGTGYGSESLMYKVLTFFSQPIACFAAAGVAASLFGGKHKLCTLVNCVIGACLCAILAMFYVFFAYNIEMFGSMALSAIACIATAVMQAKDLKVSVPDQNELLQDKYN